MENNKIKYISLVDSFLKADKIIKKAPKNKQYIIWKKLFEEKHKNLFDVYYNWGKKKLSRKLFYKYGYNTKLIVKNESYAIKNCEKILQKISKIIPIPNKLTVILFIGLHQTNGFVDKYKNGFVTFMNLEDNPDNYTLKIFLTHELLHNIHLIKNPDIYYWKGSKTNWYNSLILEGVATYLTSKALNINRADALWGNFMNKKEKREFMDWCNKNKIKLKKQLLAQIDKTKKEESQFFGGRRPRGCPYWRTGYFLGLDFVEKLSKKMKIEEIIMLKGAKLKKEIQLYLNHTI
ncbi:DUF2268 domain-containing putative Zn-dependent protease [Patescibacteria group bacterium]